MAASFSQHRLLAGGSGEGGSKLQMWGVKGLAAISHNAR